VTRVQIGDPLTRIELEVLRLAANGGTTRSIGRSLNVSEHTVNSRFKTAYDKLGVHDRPHAVALALRLGLLALTSVDADRYLDAIRERTRQAEQGLATARRLHAAAEGPGRPVCRTCSRPGLLAYWPCATARALEPTEATA
jgi:DNA-binding CsgD family transcriptional regulator